MPQNFVSATAQSIATARAGTAATIAVCAKSCEKSAIYDGARLSPSEINTRRIKARKERCGVKFRGEIQTFRDKFCRVFFEARVRRIKFDVFAAARTVPCN